MPPILHSTPWPRFKAFFRAITALVESRNGHGTGGLRYETVRAIVGRLMLLQHRVLRLIAAIAQGRYVPRRSGARRPGGPRDPNAAPRKVDPLVRRPGWLQTLIPEMSGRNGHFQELVGDPDMVAIIEAGPEALRRSLRTIGRMFGAQPFPVLARRRPASPNPPPPKPPAPARAASPKAPPSRSDYVPSAHWPAGCMPRWRQRARKIPA
jgi:hypothetical protein